jgi:Domain of unknown function DUF11
MLRRLLIVLCTIAGLSHLSPARAGAQATTGYVHLKTHTIERDGNAIVSDMGVYRTWVTGVSGLTETFTQEFAPGPHTFAKVEALYGPCLATASNVSFTIKAGQWTDVDVLMTLVDCNVAVIVNPSSAPGRVDFAVLGVVNGFAVATCNTGATNVGTFIWTSFHACQGKVPYGSLITATTTPTTLKSCCAGTSTFVANLNQTVYRREFYFIDTSGKAPPPALNADVSISRLGVTYGGQVLTATFRVTNNGPGPSYNVILDAQPDSATFYGRAAVITYMVDDGVCLAFTGACFIGVLPAGESTTLRVRYSGVPRVAGDTSAANFVTRSPSCKVARAISNMTHDVNEANNTVACLDAVPVTVALSGATPADRTVQKGTINVPMLAFTLTPASQQSVNSVTIRAEGTGNEQVDVTSVKLYLDRNANGLVDPTDSVVASGAFAANDGSVTLAIAPALVIAGPTSLLVTYSFNLTIAQKLGTGALVAALAFVLVPVMRRRKGLAAAGLLVAAGITLSSCGGSTPSTPTAPPPAAGSVTFKTTLTGVTASGTAIPAVAVSGATITVNK